MMRINIAICDDEQKSLQMKKVMPAVLRFLMELILCVKPQHLIITLR